MNKHEFITTLKSRLSILSEAEINDIINEYSDVIDQKIQDGKTEQEAVKDFGSLNDLVTDILEAYKINPERKSTFSKDFASIIETTIEKATDFFINLFRDVSSDGLAKILVYSLVVFVILIVLRIPFLILESLLSALFYFGHGSFNLFGFLINGFLSFAYLACCILIISSVIKSFKNKETPFQKSKTIKPKSPITDESVKATKVEATKETTIDLTDDEAATKASIYTYLTDDFKGKSYTYQKTTKAKPTSSLLLVLSTILKIFVGVLLIPFYMFIIIACGLLTWGLVLLFQGANILGILLIILGCIGLTGGFLKLIQRAVYRPERGRILSSFIFSMISSTICICLGIAFTFSNLGATKTLYVNQQNFKQYLSTQKMNYKTDLNPNQNYCFQDVNYNVIEDRNLDNEIEFNVTAPSFTRIHFNNDNLSYDIQAFKFINFIVNQIKNNTWVSLEDSSNALIDLEIRVPEYYKNKYSVKNNCIRFN